jgi:hypothetical protein
MTKGFFLLQSVQYFKQDDPTAAIALLASVGALIVIFLTIGFIRNGIRVGSVRAGSARVGQSRVKTAAAPGKINTSVLRRAARAYGLDREQTRLLGFVFQNDQAGDPERVLGNAALLDKHFKRAYKAIERNTESEEEVQQRLVKLFSLRNALEGAQESGGAISTSQLAENTAAVLATGKESYPVRVISAKGAFVVVENPKNAIGTSVRIPKGSKVTLSFFTKSSKGFAFDSKVVDTTSTPHGPGLQLSHSGKAKLLAQRRYKRKQISARCFFYLVFVDTVKIGKRKQVPKLVVDNRRYGGTVLDISIGGCSIKVSTPVQVGSRLKISIDSGNNSTMTVLGQVLRINRTGAAGTVMHIKFLKIPKKAFNSISALVFGYDEE